MIETTALSGTAQEIIEYLQANGDGARYLLTREPSTKVSDASLSPLSVEEEEKLLDKLGALGKGRLDPALTYGREDIYFDR